MNNKRERPFVETETVRYCGGWDPSSARLIAAGQDFEYKTCSNEFNLYLLAEAPLVFLNPRPRSDKLSLIYPPEYIPFHFHQMKGPVRIARDFVQKRKARAILKLAGTQGTILDAGCGSAAVLRMIAMLRGPEGLYANDFDDSILEPLRKIGIKTIVGELNSLEVEEKFNVISLNQVIEHLPDPWAAVKNLSRFLKKDGFLFIETPSIDAIDMKVFRKRYWGGYHIPRHFYLFNEKSISAVLGEAGLELTSIKYIPNPIFWAQSFHHLFEENGYVFLSKFWTHKNPLVMAFFTLIDMIILAVYGRTSNMRVIAKKIS